MLDYTGIKCPVCGEPFKSDDDIVVCPECGAPYHRDCYNQNGKCIFDELHEKKESWHPPKPEKEEPHAKGTEYEIRDRECPECGVLNPHSSLFCSRCGAPLSGQPDTHVNRDGNNFNEQNGNQNQQNGPMPPFGGGVYYGMPPIFFDPLGGVNPTDTVDENITFGEASKIVQQNTRYYIPVFNKIKSTGKSKFNFSAFLFSGPWFLYRKQYKAGIVLTALIFLIYIAQNLLSLFVSAPVLNELFMAIGVDPTAATEVSYEQMMALSSVLEEHPEYYLPLICPLLASIGMLIVMLFCGFKANRMYMKHCVNTIKSIKAKDVDNETYNTLVIEQGGVNTYVTFAFLILYMILSYLPLLL
ncbi:MAG: DUF2628 domain-containing protein [Ruminococcaceae bacterium]|nr:DUF2628 domain-containing protein [Oscillospiraceae bacterium]